MYVGIHEAYMQTCPCILDKYILCVCVYMYVCVYIKMHMYVCMYVCMYVRTYVCMCTWSM